MTLEAWFKDEDPAGYSHPRKRILTKGATSVNAEVPYFLAIDSNSFYAGVRTGGVSRVLSFDLSGVSANAWHHVAITLQASNRLMTMYLDGVQVSQVGLSGISTIGNTGPLDIGHNPIDGNFWRGKLDDIRIWNLVRTPAEIQANYQNELSGAPAGLVGNWRFNEGFGSSTADNAGAPQNASFFGGATWSNDVPGGPPLPTPTPSATPTTGPSATPSPTATTGPSATAIPTATATPTVIPGAASSLSLNGTTAYASAPHAAELNTTGDDFTLEAWFKDENPLGYNHSRARILTKGDTSSDTEVPYFVSIDSNGLFGGVRTGGLSRILRVDLASVSAHAWHHVAITLRAPTRVMTIYLDGVQVGQGALSGISTSGDTAFWRGKLDDVRIWNLVRTATEIQTNYQNQLSGAPAGLVGNWRFNEGFGSSTADSAGAPQNASLFDAASWAADYPGGPPPGSTPTATTVPTNTPTATSVLTSTPTMTATSANNANGY